MKKILFVIASCIYISGFGQGTTIIPKEEQVDLPLNREKKIELSVELDESHFDPNTLKALFIDEAEKYFDTDKYFLVDTFGNKIEYFVLAPCMNFELKELSKQVVKSDGMVTSSVFIEFLPTSYIVNTQNYKWVDLNSIEHDVSSMYLKYKASKNLKEKVGLYGILKSSEYSLIESFEGITTTIDAIIEKKSNNLNK